MVATTRRPQRLAPRRGERLYRLVTVLVLVFVLLTGVGAVIGRVHHQVGLNNRIIEAEYLLSQRLVASFEGVTHIEFLGYYENDFMIGGVEFGFRVNGYQDLAKIGQDLDSITQSDVNRARLSSAGSDWIQDAKGWYARTSESKIRARDSLLDLNSKDMEHVAIDYNLYNLYN